MAAVANTLRARAAAAGAYQPAAPKGLPPRAHRYLFAVMAVAAATTTLVLSLQGFTFTARAWATLGILAIAASTAQLFVVHTPRNRLFHTGIVFVIPGVLLLPPALLVLMVVAQHVPDWLRRRYPWYIQTFNICNYAISGLAAALAASRVAGALAGIGSLELRLGASGVAGCVVFLVCNHVLLARMLFLARGHTLPETGLFSSEWVATDFVLLLLGAGLVIAYHSEASLIPIVLSPLVLIHRSMSVPHLQAQAQVDPKTGLFNPRHFDDALKSELARSSRVGTPLTLLMADLDLLRAINNTHGHLAGDAVLKGIAEIIGRHVREYDVAARFGGEEFAVLLPETNAEEGARIAERIREAVAAHAFAVASSGEPVRATLSIGVASCVAGATGAERLIHAADVALYAAKDGGRNRVVSAPTPITAMAA